MPQLDKVTFLSQFFWFCVVFFSMYITLVKYYLPALARIVKLRQTLGNTSSTDSEDTSNQETNKNSQIVHVMEKSIEASIAGFQAHQGFLHRWGTNHDKEIASSISPNFKEGIASLRQGNSLLDFSLLRVVPPVGRQNQKLAFEDNSQGRGFNHRCIEALYDRTGTPLDLSKPKKKKSSKPSPAPKKASKKASKNSKK